MKTITARALSALLKAGDAEPPLLLDVREQWEFAICQIDGSRNVPMAEIPSVIPEIDTATATVVICHHGMRSAEVAAYMERCGFGNVSNLDGGVDAWARDVDPNMPTY